MKAVYYGGEGRFSIGEAYPMEPGPGEVTVKIHYCGICGSDVHISKGSWDRRIAAFPRIIGHEASGVISALGSNVSGWSVGDRVVIRPLRTCGKCPACLSGNGNICKQVKYLGIEEDGAFQNSWNVDASILYCTDALTH